MPARLAMVRERAIFSIETEHGRQRGQLRVLAWLLVVLLLLVHGIVTAAWLAGSALDGDMWGLNGICLPLTLGSMWFLRWTYRRAEAPLVEALRCEPPRVRGGGHLELRGRYGVHDAVEIETLDGKLWRIRMEAPLVHEVVAWLQRAGAANASADAGYRAAAPMGPRSMLPWSTLTDLPNICVRCAAPTARRGTVRLTLRGHATLPLSLPVCIGCHRRGVLRIAVIVVVALGAVVGGAVLASHLYPPGNMRGLVILAAMCVAGVVLYGFHRLTRIPSAIAEHDGGTAGQELYVRFSNPLFAAEVREANRMDR